MGKINKLNQNEIIKDFKKVHGNKYDYSLVKYTRNIDPVEIICPIHGMFKQKPQIHRRGGGCKYCANLKKSKKLLTPFSKIKKEAEIKHGSKYKYFEYSYIDKNTPMLIKCDIHGNFFQKPETHLLGSGCPKCSYDIQAFKTKDSLTKVLEDFKKVHGNKYDYSKVRYKNTMTKVEIICLEHGSFFQKPNAHKSGRGCPIYNQSYGEIKIEKFLKQNDLKFKKQFIFEDCFNIKPLKYDFYLEDLNIVIEYDGKQHFEPIKHFGGLESFLKIQKRDKIKNDYCKNNKIFILRIPYWDFNKIEKLIEEEVVKK